MMKNVGDAQVIQYIGGIAWGIDLQGTPVGMGPQWMVEEAIEGKRELCPAAQAVVEVERALREKANKSCQEMPYRRKKMVEAGRKAAATRKANKELMLCRAR